VSPDDASFNRRDALILDHVFFRLRNNFTDCHGAVFFEFLQVFALVFLSSSRCLGLFTWARDCAVSGVDILAELHEDLGCSILVARTVTL
jgi:hypothetical protein